MLPALLSSPRVGCGRVLARLTSPATSFAPGMDLSRRLVPISQALFSSEASAGVEEVEKKPIKRIMAANRGKNTFLCLALLS